MAPLDISVKWFVFGSAAAAVVVSLFVDTLPTHVVICKTFQLIYSIFWRKNQSIFSFVQLSNHKNNAKRRERQKSTKSDAQNECEREQRT